MWSICYSVKGLHHKCLNMGVFAMLLQSLYTSLGKSVTLASSVMEGATFAAASTKI